MSTILGIVEWDRDLTLAINGSESLFWDNLMIVCTNTFAWFFLIVMLLFILFKNNSVKDTLMILLTIGVMIFVADRLCSGFVKPFVARWRPTQDPDIMYLVDTVRNYRGGRFGFFSGHACNTTCVAMFLSWIFRSRKLTIVLFIWAAIATFTRLYLGVHYVGDVTVGAICGCTIGYLFYKAYHFLFKKELHTHRLSEQYTESGYLKSDIDLFMCTIFLNYILLIIFSLTIGII